MPPRQRIRFRGYAATAPAVCRKQTYWITPNAPTARPWANTKVMPIALGTTQPLTKISRGHLRSDYLGGMRPIAAWVVFHLRMTKAQDPKARPPACHVIFLG